jgi:hypothetical protein
MRITPWMFYVGTALVESECIVTAMGISTNMICPPPVMLTLRTWAVWNRDWRLGIGLSIFFVLCWGPSIKILLMLTKSLACKHHTFVNHENVLMISVF